MTQATKYLATVSWLVLRSEPVLIGFFGEQTLTKTKLVRTRTWSFLGVFRLALVINWLGALFGRHRACDSRLRFFVFQVKALSFLFETLAALRWLPFRR